MIVGNIELNNQETWVVKIVEILLQLIVARSNCPITKYVVMNSRKKLQSKEEFYRTYFFKEKLMNLLRRNCH